MYLKSWKPLIVLLATSTIFALGRELVIAQEKEATARNFVPSEVISSLPKGNFMENLAIGPDGAFYITSYVAREILRYHPKDGLRHFVELDVHPIGIDFDADGIAYISAHGISIFSGKDFRRSNVIYTMDLKGQTKLWKTMEKPGFLNGVLCLSPGHLAIADSYAGVIWKLNTEENTIEPMIRDELLEPVSQSSIIPAANGLKIFHDYLYISNSDRRLLVRTPISESGNVGQLEVVHKDIEIDDFAFSESGTLYSTTHADRVFRTGSNGERQIIAGIEQGILGNAAAAFGQTEEDSNQLYVVGDGGLFADTELQPANIVRLSVNEKGYTERSCWRS